MNRKRGLVALSVAAIVTLLVVAVFAVVRPTTDEAELADSPSESGRSSAAPSTGVTLSPRPREADRPAKQPKPRKPQAAIDQGAVTALKAALKKAGRAQAATPKPALVPGGPPKLDFVLSSFNVLGSSHSAPGGTRSAMAPGTTRIRWVAGLLARHGVDVVGFQEFQLDQARTFSRVTRGRYGVYPGTRLGGRGAQNSIAWRTDTWEVVDAATVPIPYFNGNRMPMPVVLLRNRDTGLRAYFTNFHNPASISRLPNQGRWRGMALAREIALVKRLIARTGYPVFLTGDLNEREDAFCAVTGRSAMVAANGGSNDGSCRPPGSTGIDWIFGSPDATFSNYGAVRSGLVNRISDHPMLLSNVRIEGGSGQR